MNMMLFQDKVTRTRWDQLFWGWGLLYEKSCFSVAELWLKPGVWTTGTIPGGCPQTHGRLSQNVIVTM